MWVCQSLNKKSSEFSVTIVGGVDCMLKWILSDVSTSLTEFSPYINQLRISPHRYNRIIDVWEASSIYTCQWLGQSNNVLSWLVPKRADHHGTQLVERSLKSADCLTVPSSLRPGCRWMLQVDRGHPSQCCSTACIDARLTAAVPHNADVLVPARLRQVAS